MNSGYNSLPERAIASPAVVELGERHVPTEAIALVFDVQGPPVLTPGLARALLRAIQNVERQRAAEDGNPAGGQPPALAS